MFRILKRLLLALGVLVGLGVALFFYSFFLDRWRFEHAANPCERACIEDSGGLTGCRQECAGHPNSYGPNTDLH